MVAQARHSDSNALDANQPQLKQMLISSGEKSSQFASNVIAGINDPGLWKRGFRKQMTLMDHPAMPEQQDATVGAEPAPATRAAELKAAARKLAAHCAAYRGASISDAVWQVGTTAAAFIALVAVMLYTIEFSYPLTLLFCLPAAGLLIRGLGKGFLIGGRVQGGDGAAIGHFDHAPAPAGAGGHALLQRARHAVDEFVEPLQRQPQAGLAISAGVVAGHRPLLEPGCRLRLAHRRTAGTARRKHLGQKCPDGAAQGPIALAGTVAVLLWTEPVAGQQRRKERLQLMEHGGGLIGSGQRAAGGGQAGPVLR